MRATYGGRSNSLRPRLAIIFLLIVLAPLAAIVLLGYRLMRGEQEMVEHRYRALVQQRLQDVNSQISRMLERRAGEIADLLSKTKAEPEAMRKLVSDNSLVSNAFAIDPSGRVLFPTTLNELNQRERDFLFRTSSLWESRELEYGAPDEQQAFQGQQVGLQQAPKQMQQATGGKTSFKKAPAKDTQSQTNQLQNSSQSQQVAQLSNIAPTGERRRVGTSGWFPWFTGDGISLLYYTVQPSSVIVGAEMSRSRLIADTVAILPSTSAAHPDPPDARIVLRDSHNAALYQWGGYKPGQRQKPNAVLQLSFPLTAWHLEYFDAGASSAQLARTVRLSAALSAGAVGLMLLALAAYFYRENTRQIREAEQRVTFVNQVSHELKTPLTNIRMYAEMLEGKLAETEEGARRNLNVIISESQRLSRLIANVLSFGRQNRHVLKLQMRPAIPDDIVSGVLDAFRPALAARGISVEFVPGAPQTEAFDNDALEQIVGNLLSNVEKYASGGERVTVTTAMEDHMLVVVVEDDGPGIPRRLRKKIFEPFFRASDKLNEGVSGTGIGLTISRDLARLHGGNLVLMDSKVGAAFKLTLRSRPV